MITANLKAPGITWCFFLAKDLNLLGNPFPMLFQEITFSAQELAFVASLVLCALFGMEYQRLEKEQKKWETVDKFLRD